MLAGCLSDDHPTVATDQITGRFSSSEVGWNGAALGHRPLRRSASNYQPIVDYLSAVPSEHLLDAALWKAFRMSFVSNGRVIDKDNGGISHSEGQGYGMILAEASGDRAIFE